MSHYYTATGELVDPGTPGSYPSPSTILDIIANPGIDAFRARVGNEAADMHMVMTQERGTRVHTACEIYAGTGDFDLAQKDLQNDEIEYLIGFANWVEKYRVKFLYLEQFLTNETLKYRGRTDWIAELIHPDSGEVTVWDGDTKTGMTRPKHGLQLKFYREALVDMVKRSLIAWEHDMPVTKVRMGALYLDPKRACGYRYFKSDWGMLEYRESLSAIKAHLAVFKWWARKNPVRQREEGIVWEP